MAEENQEAPEESKPAGFSLLFIIIGVVLGAALGGGGVFFGLAKGMASNAADGSSQEESAETVGFDERVLSLDPFVVNVSGEAYPRYVKLSLAFELDSLEAKEECETRIAQIRDLTILLLSSKRLGDINGFEGKSLLKDDLRERVNGVLKKGKVESVLFTEFVIQ